MGWEYSGYEGEQEHIENILSQSMPEINFFKLRYTCVRKELKVYLQEMRETFLQNFKKQSLGSCNKGNERCLSIKYG
jgi:hypothetical protein